MASGGLSLVEPSRVGSIGCCVALGRLSLEELSREKVSWAISVVECISVVV